MCSEPASWRGSTRWAADSMQSLKSLSRRESAPKISLAAAGVARAGRREADRPEPARRAPATRPRARGAVGACARGPREREPDGHEHPHKGRLRLQGARRLPVSHGGPLEPRAAEGPPRRGRGEHPDSLRGRARPGQAGPGRLGSTTEPPRRKRAGHGAPGGRLRATGGRPRPHRRPPGRWRIFLNQGGGCAAAVAAVRDNVCGAIRVGPCDARARRGPGRDPRRRHAPTLRAIMRLTAITTAPMGWLGIIS